MNYYEQDDKKSRIWGIIGVALYAVLCIGVMFITYTVSLPEPEPGILVDFGTTDRAGGLADLPVSEVDTRPANPEQHNQPTEDIMTTDDPEAPAIVEEPRPQAQPAPPVEETAPRREVNQRAMFPGRTENSTSASQGSTEGAGNQGVQEGSSEGGDSGGGSGIDGINLAGRYGVVPLPLPVHPGNNLSGRVVVRINVDSTGKVTGASYEQSGSNTNHPALVSAALTAAARTRFTPDETKDIQTGTITYIFRLN